MLKVEGLFQINLTIQGASELGIPTPDLRELELIEVAGVGLPMLKGIVVCYDQESRALFHEGNKLTISYGVGNPEDPDDIIDTQFIITNISVRRTQGQYNLAFTGLYDAMPYLVEHKQRAFKDVSALEAILTVAKDHFGESYIDSNVTKSNDRMTWLQPAIPDKKFISDTWMHADLPDSFPMVGITVDGKFRVRDLATLIAKDGADPSWKFFPDNVNSADPKKLWYHGDYEINTNSGFMNHWLGYGNTLDVTDVDLGEYEEVLEETAPQLAKAEAFPRLSEATGRRGTPRQLNDNEHPRYWHAYQQNTTQLALYSTVTVKLSYDDKLHKDMRILDLVYFAEANNTQDQFDNPFTGLYIISKLSRKFSKNQIVTTVELSRETLTDIKGDVR